MKFFEFKEGKIYRAKETVDNIYRLSEGKIEQKVYKNWKESLLSPMELYDMDFEEMEDTKGWIVNELEFGAPYVSLEENKTMSRIYGGMYYEKDIVKDAIAFDTVEKAMEIREEQTLYRLMKRFRDLNDIIELDWKANRSKYYIDYDHDIEDYAVHTAWWREILGVVYFSNYELAERCIEEIVRPYITRDGWWNNDCKDRYK